MEEFIIDKLNNFVLIIKNTEKIRNIVLYDYCSKINHRERCILNQKNKFENFELITIDNEYFKVINNALNNIFNINFITRKNKQYFINNYIITNIPYVSRPLFVLSHLITIGYRYQNDIQLVENKCHYDLLFMNFFLNFNLPMSNEVSYIKEYCLNIVNNIDNNEIINELINNNKININIKTLIWFSIYYKKNV